MYISKIAQMFKEESLNNHLGRRDIWVGENCCLGSLTLKVLWWREGDRSEKKGRKQYHSKSELYSLPDPNPCSMKYRLKRGILIRLLSGEQIDRHISAAGRFKATHPKEVNAVSLPLPSYCPGLLQQLCFSNHAETWNIPRWSTVPSFCTVCQLQHWSGQATPEDCSNPESLPWRICPMSRTNICWHQWWGDNAALVVHITFSFLILALAAKLLFVHYLKHRIDE